MLVGRRDHLVARLEPEAGEDDVAAVGRRGRQRDRRPAETPTSVAIWPRSSSRSSRSRANCAARPAPVPQAVVLAPPASPRSFRARAARRSRPAGTRSARAPGTAARASSKVTRGILPTARLTFAADARRHRRPARVHAAVRPLARRRSRACRRRRRARDVPLPVRLGRARRRLRSARVVLSALVADRRDTASGSRVKALEHPLGMARLAIAEARRPARPVARGARARPLALPPAQPGRPHGARRHPAPHARRRRRCGERCSRGSTRVVVHSRARSRAAARLRRRPRASSRSSATRSSAPRSTDATTAARRSASASSARTRGRRTPSRRCSASTTPGSSSSGTRACRSTACSGRPATVPSGGSATSPTRSCGARSRRRRSRSFPYRAEIDVSGALLQVLGAGVPAIVYDIGGLGEVVGRFGAGAVVRPGDVEAMSAALARLLDDADALADRTRGRRARARRADLGRIRRRPPRALPRSSRDLPARSLPRRSSSVSSISSRRRRSFSTRRPRRTQPGRRADVGRVRGALRRLPARRRRDRRRAPRHPRDIRGDARRATRRTSTAPRSTAAARKRFGRYASSLTEDANGADRGLRAHRRPRRRPRSSAARGRSTGSASRASTRGRASRAPRNAENGHWTIQPAGEFRPVGRRYRGDTLVLESELETDSGVVRLIDFMPPRETNPTSSGSSRAFADASRCGWSSCSASTTGRSCRGFGRSRARSSRSPDRTPCSSERRSRTRGATSARRRRSPSPRATACRSSCAGSRRNEPTPEPIDPEQALTRALAFWEDWAATLHVRGPLARRGPPLAAHAEGTDVRADRRHRRRADDLAARVDRRRAELGLPLLLAPRRDPHAARAHPRRLRRGGAGRGATGSCGRSPGRRTISRSCTASRASAASPSSSSPGSPGTRARGRSASATARRASASSTSTAR